MRRSRERCEPLYAPLVYCGCFDVSIQTVGALLSRSYTAGGCLLGAIFGTGTNGAYVEDLNKLTKLEDEALRSSGGRMIVNTEWGAFNNSVCSHPLPQLSGV